MQASSIFADNFNAKKINSTPTFANNPAYWCHKDAVKRR